MYKKMKVDFPWYENEKLHYNTDNIIEKIADENNYFKSIFDVINFLENDAFSTIEKCLEFKKQIETAINKNKIIKFIYEGTKEEINNNKFVTKEMPINIKKKWDIKVNELNDIHKDNAKKDDTFIKENVNELFKEIDKLIIKLQNKLKESRQNANKKYYEKQKKLMNTVITPPKTSEEIMQSRKEANHKFYLKRKEVLKDFKYVAKTDEEKAEAKKEANKKYYEKKK